MNELQANSMYITVDTRGVPGTFVSHNVQKYSWANINSQKHWGIFIHSQNWSGIIYHAVNRSGGWFPEIKPTEDIRASQTLVLLLKLAGVSTSSFGLCDSTLRNVPANGTVSARTGEAFTCRIWVKDVTMALHDAKLITLTKSIG